MLLDQGKSPSTVNRYVAAFRSFLSCAFPDHPRVSWRALKEPKGRERIPTQAELLVFLQSLEDPNRALTQCLAETGLRLSELWTSSVVALPGSSLRQVCVPDSKSGRARRFLVPESVAGLMAQVPYTTARVFRAEWNKARVASGMPWLIPHMLRHYRASVLASQGVPVPVIAEILGHSTWKTTMRYVHADQGAIERAALVSGL